MRTIYVSPEFPLNRRMRKDVRRGKLQVIREGGERSSLGGGIPSGKKRGLRTTGSRLVCMADNGAEVGGGLGSQAAFIDELSCKRKRFVQEAEDTIDFEHFVRLYNDHAHFVYEVAQNAEDASASRLRIGIEEGRIVVAHNGRDFNCADVESVTKIARTSKGQTEQIGKFGIGFKSVFALTDRPEIHSGGFHFSIEKLVIPSRIQAEGNGQGTLIALPLKESASNLIGDVANKMNYLLHAPEDILLFLEKVREFRMRWGDCLEDVVLHKDEEFHCSATGLDSAVAVIMGGANGTRRFRVFRRERMEVAYLLACDAKDEGEFMPEQNPPVSVYFPTGSRPGLHFRLHIPYTPDASRQSINYRDQNNALLTADAARLVADTLPVLRDEKLLTSSFIQGILPDISKFNQDVYLDSSDPAHLHLAVAQEIKAMFASGEQLLPAADGGYVAASDAILGLENLREFLSEEDAQKIWKRGKWIDPDLRGNSMLVALGIPQVRLQNFAASVGDDFFQQQDDDWLLRFYGALADKFPYGWGANPAVSEPLSRKAFVRLENGECVAPGLQKIYLSGGKNDRFPTVKRMFLDDERAGKLFRDVMGLRAPDLGDVVAQFIAPHYPADADPNVNESGHAEDMRIAIKAMDEFPERVLSALSGRLFVMARIGADAPKLCKPEDCYFPSKRTKAWFKGMNIPFVDVKFYDERFSDKWRDMFAKLGVAEDIRIRHDCDYTANQQGCFRYGENGFNPLFDIHGLDFVMRNMSFQRSKIAWEIAVTKCHMIRGFISYWSKKIPREMRVRELSDAGKKLSGFSWLYNQDRKLINKSRHGEITLPDLVRAGYSDCGTDRARIVAEIIGLEIGGNEEKQNVNVLSTVTVPQEEYEELKRKADALDRLLQKDKIESQITDFDVLPEDALIGPPKVVDSSRRRPPRSGVSRENRDATVDISPETNPDSDERIHDDGSIGEWAETYAQRCLEEKFPGASVESGNADGQRAEGYDLQVVRPDSSVLFIEVKGKKGEKPSYVDVTRAQWEKAKQEGENYWLVVVVGVGQKNADWRVIKNPAEEFRAGKLDAHPVRVWL